MFRRNATVYPSQLYSGHLVFLDHQRPCSVPPLASMTSVDPKDVISESTWPKGGAGAYAANNVQDMNVRNDIEKQNVT